MRIRQALPSFAQAPEHGEASNLQELIRARVCDTEAVREMNWMAPVHEILLHGRAWPALQSSARRKRMPVECAFFNPGAAGHGQNQGGGNNAGGAGKRCFARLACTRHRAVQCWSRQFGIVSPSSKPGTASLFDAQVRRPRTTLGRQAGSH